MSDYFFPLRDKLEEAFPNQGDALYGLLSRKVDPRTLPKTQEWVDATYFPPGFHEVMMHALNEILDGGGVEGVYRGYVDFAIDSQIGEGPLMEYVNMGDAYVATIIFEPDQRRYTIGDWATWVEENQPRFYPQEQGQG